MLKRINNEMKELTKKFPNTTINDAKNEITIDNKKFILYSTYPFTKPNVFINNITYHKYFTAPTRKIHKILDKGNHKCLCCKTVLCSWMPGYGISTIMQEIENNNKIKEETKYILSVEKLAKKINGISIDNIHLILEYLIENYLITYPPSKYPKIIN